MSPSALLPPNVETNCELGALGALGALELRANEANEPNEANEQFRTMPWWLTPPGLIALIPLPALLIAIAVSPGSYRKLWRVEKIIDGETAWLFLLGILAFTIGTFAPRRLGRLGRPSRKQVHGSHRWPNFSPTQLDRLQIAHKRCLTITLVGYAIYLGIAVLKAGPSTYVHVLLSGDNYDGALKDLTPSIPGVTTLSQVGVIVAVMSELLYRITRETSYRRWLLLLIGLAAFRSFFYTERLATIEVVVPVLVLGAMYVWRNGTAKQRRQLILAPLLALPLLIGVFGVFEHSRSWVFYRQYSNDSYPEFVGKRLAGYYATSFNNGALLTKQYNENFMRMPFFTADAIWSAPIIGQLHAYKAITGEEGLERWDRILSEHANPEFNSPCGIAGPFVDYGRVGGLIFLGLLGLTVGFLWRRFDGATPMGLLLYPIAVVAVSELPRYGYLTAGRATPALLFGVVTAVWMQRAPK
jgi:oligosaccharide repeat unit polymerase